MAKTLEHIAHFGSSGQSGGAILDDLLQPAVPNYHSKIRCFFQSSDKRKINSIPTEP